MLFSFFLFFLSFFFLVFLFLLLLLLLRSLVLFLFFFLLFSWCFSQAGCQGSEGAGSPFVQGSIRCPRLRCMDLRASGCRVRAFRRQYCNLLLNTALVFFLHILLWHRSLSTCLV